MSDAKSTTDHHGTTRRTVVRTAAHAAWAVPAIQIAAAAPAFAASNVNGIESPAYIVSTGKTRTVSNISVVNDGPTQLPVGSVQLILSVSGGKNPVWENPKSSGNWRLLAGSTAGSQSLTFYYASAVPVGKPVTSPVLLTGSVEATLSDNGQDPVVTVLVKYIG